MPPRYAYWTIIVDGQPTAFRAAQQEDLMPTFKRLMAKHPSAKLVWFQNGKIWASRLDAQEAMRERGERGRIGDKRQGGFRDRKFAVGRERERPQWTPKTSRPQEVKTAEKLEWKPKGEFTPAAKRERRPDRDGRPEWKPKGSVDRERRPAFKPKGSFDRDRKPEWKPRGSFDRERKLEWTPKGSAPETARTEKRKWVPKAEYKKSKGIEVPRDRKWRPGGEHRDPKQKYKDAKKAKWTKFKQNIRAKWESKQGGNKPPKRRREE